ncbi:hypothetical protein GCK72_002335 [Caenorhabditis remanei]|uniref:Uncharacterized protein n=1 Tax=Caenorhabditis remanei TaxID=31234 RepID=A0A6A5HUV5_CAERE|nr:hypothetical protein GCK72_002335 [Caenorhabditis remanei]KAF1770516.1 hypothetical protein GCK72_002335 [Caenorhabditis remanei]
MDKMRLHEKVGHLGDFQHDEWNPVVRHIGQRLDSQDEMHDEWNPVVRHIGQRLDSQDEMHDEWNPMVRHIGQRLDSQSEHGDFLNNPVILDFNDCSSFFSDSSITTGTTCSGSFS